MIKKIKSISKRTLAMVLTTLMLLSSGIVGTLAANVDLAPTGANISSGTVIYFDNSTFGWTNPCIQLMVGHSSWSQGYKMTKLNDTNLYYVSMPKWDGATQLCVFGTDSEWGGEGNSISNRKGWAPNSTPIYSLGSNISGTQLLTTTTSALTRTALSAYTALNTTQTATVQSAAAGSTDYKDDTAAGTTSISTYKLSSATASASSTGTTSASAARTAQVTMTATAKTGYTFKGWYNSSGTQQTTSTTLTYTCNGSAATYYARFEKQSKYSYTIEAGTGGTVSPTSGSVDQGSTVTITATPKEGYTFSKWTSTTGTFGNANSASTTFKPSVNNAKATATFNPINYTITYKNYDGTPLSTGSADYGTKVKLFNGAPSETPTKPSTETTNYTFATWVYEDGKSVGADDTIKGDTILVASYTESERTYKVTISDPVGGTVTVTANGATIANGGSVPYGTDLNLTADPDKFYTVGTWTANGAAVSGTTYTVTDNVTLAHTFDVKPSSVITFNYDNTLGSLGMTGGTGDIETVTAQKAYKVEKDGTLTVTISIKPGAEGYYIKQIGTTSYEGQYGNNSVKHTVTATDTDQTIAVDIAEIPSTKVNYVVAPTGSGTVEGTTKVYEGSQGIAEAKPADGYHFVNWTFTPEGAINTDKVDLNSSLIYFIPQKEMTFTANFAPNTGTVKVSAAEGGSVDSEGGTVIKEGEHEVTYPETVVATATENKADGYLFTHWAVKGQCKDGSEAKEGTDYAIVRENDNVIEIRILTNGTVVDVVANFANSQKIKVYTYSDGGFTSLTIKETEGNSTLTPFDGEQTAVHFGENTWYTPGDVTLTAGYNDAITAKMYGDNPLTSGTGTLVMFKNTLKWDKVYFYGKDTSLYKGEVVSGNETAVSTKGVNALPMIRIGNSDYYYIYVDKNYAYKAFSEHGQGDYDWFYQTEASYPNKGNAGAWSATKPCFVPSTTVTWSNVNQTNYYNNGKWEAIPDVSTETAPVDITAALYDGNAWKGVEEIWIYIDSENNCTITTTDRRELINEVTSANMVGTYNNGVNDMEYTSATWTAFTNAYKAARTASGNPALTDAELDAVHTTLLNAYKALTVEPKVTIIGTHGAEPHTNSDDYFGKTKFPGFTFTTNNGGNIGDANTSEPYNQGTSYLSGSVDRHTVLTINTQLESKYIEDYMVYGWVVNGTEWIPATEDIATKGLYVGTYKCEKSATIVPVYFRKNTIQNWETDNNIVKIYANTAGSSEKWGNYMSAYTWTNNKSYYQFGHWTGQVMIPDTSNPGMYYTFLEFTSPDGKDNVAGIAFTNYGGNKPYNEKTRYQTYDYYEFKELKDLGYNNIVFQLKTFEGNENYPSTSKATLSNYQFEAFRDFSGNMIDITRKELTDEQEALDPELYIVRTGPVKATEGQGYRRDPIKGSDFYIDTYVYDKEGNFIVGCKSFELLDLATLSTKSGKDLTQYAGKPVMVDYASLTSKDGNNRFDGEWYGTIYGLTNVTIKTEVAYLEDGQVTYYYGQNSVEGVGQAYINGEHTQEVPHASEGHVISANVPDGNDFVGWYRAIVSDDGKYTIDITAKPLFIERSATIDASADAVYVAVFKEHPEGAFTVNNYYYTYDDFSGQTMSPYVPPVFGNNTNYSIRDVEVDRIYNAYLKTDNDVDNDRAGTYTQTLDSVNVGDILRITIYTKPTYPRDYVYAWYIQANDSYGINFEEIGTTATNPSLNLMTEEKFTFDYVVKEGVSSITIFSDVVHTSDIVTLNYIYTNRFGVEKKYVVKHKLTEEELTKNNYKPTSATIRDNAPKVDDLFKDVVWNVDLAQSDATNYTLRAEENAYFDIIVNIGDEIFEYKKKYNESMEIKAYELVEGLDRSKPGIWYLETGKDGKFTKDYDTILGYGQYYGLVVTGDANIYYTDDYKLVTQIVLADAVYGAEKVTDENGKVTVDKVYVDYLISYLINVFNGQYIDLNDNGHQDANEPTVYEANNVSNPCSVKAIREAGYTVDYGLVLELLNTFKEATKQSVLDTYYGKNKTLTDKIQGALDSKIALEKASDTAGLENLKKYGYGDTGYADTHYFIYDAEDYGFGLTNKNRVLMTFGYDNNKDNRMRYYNAMAYLVISDSNGNNSNYYYSNQATLNIQEADKIEN